MSPPTSPIRPAPPVSALPSIPQSTKQFQAAAEPEASEPTEPSAPPASPSLLDFLPPTEIDENISQLLSEAEQQPLNFEPMQFLTNRPDLDTGKTEWQAKNILNKCIERLYIYQPSDASEHLSILDMSVSKNYSHPIHFSPYYHIISANFDQLLHPC